MATLPGQFQHYIPQFLIKNFAHPFKCPVIEKTGKKKCKCKHERGMHHDDPVVNCVNLQSTPAQIEVRPVRRIFGITDMYDDKTKATTKEQRRIENRFSVMESQASTIIRRFVKALENGEDGVSITRIDRDLLRKFLFILKYRGRGFHYRFNHNEADGYDSNDRQIMLDYMQRHGFKTPMDVWFHNLEAIMDLTMDSDLKWVSELPTKMFPCDAAWFIAHTQMYYLAFCTPSNPSQEFILTDNCFNVFEGPSTFIRDQKTNEIIPSYHAGFHEFAPVSPRLMVVLRSLMLPNPEEDQDPEIKEWRDNHRWSSFEQVYGTDVSSALSDLPVRKARTRYVQTVIDLDEVPLRGPMRIRGNYKPNDVFTFTFCCLHPRHVRIVNSILLDNTYRCTAIGFKSHEAFFDTLESFISSQSDWTKAVGGVDADLQMQQLLKLETIVKEMGSKKDLVYLHMIQPEPVDSEEFLRRNDAFSMHIQSVFMREDEYTEPSIFERFLELYARLGTWRQISPSLFSNKLLHFIRIERLPKMEAVSRLDTDIAQSGKMLHFFMMTYAWGSSPETQVQLNLLFLNSRPGRFWLYQKLLRRLRTKQMHGMQDYVDLFSDEEWQNGPEDVFAKSKSEVSASFWLKH